MKSKINKADLGGCFLIFSFIIFFIWFVLRKLEHGLGDGYDAGTYSQILWTTLHGKLLWCSFTGLHGACDLGVHINLTILLLSPLYALFPFPATLAIIQVFFLGIAAVPLYLIAKEKINARVGLLFTIFYLTNNFTIQSIIEGFQTRTISTPLYFFAFYFLLKKRYLLFNLLLLLLCLTHETNSLLVFMLGIYVIFIQRRILMGIIISIFSLGWFILTIKVFQPFFGCHYPLGALQFIVKGETLFNPVQIIQYCFTHPINILGRAFSYPKLDYFIRLFGPLGFLSLLSLKELLIGLPFFLQNFILSEIYVRIELPRQTMPIIPFVFISAIYSAAYLFKKLKAGRLYLGVFIIICWVISTYKFVWDPAYNCRFLQILAPESYETRIHREALKKIASLVPPDASICSDIKAFPFLANRFKLYDLPFHIEESEYILVDKKQPDFSPKPIFTKEKCLAIVNTVLSSSNYAIIKKDDGVILLKKKAVN